MDNSKPGLQRREGIKFNKNKIIESMGCQEGEGGLEKIALKKKTSLKAWDAKKGEKKC